MWWAVQDWSLVSCHKTSAHGNLLSGIRQGSHILSNIAQSSSISAVYALSRKELPAREKVKPLVADSSSWATTYPQDASLFFSALGTTRGAAGGFQNQRKIDYDLNLELAKAAKAAGTKIYVLVSSSGANASSSFGYMKMKGELDEAVKALDFEHCIVLRPGLLLGERKADKNVFETLAKKVATLAASVSGNRLTDFWAQQAEVVARAAVRASLDCVEGKEKEKFRILGQADVVRLGRTEWHA